MLAPKSKIESVCKEFSRTTICSSAHLKRTFCLRHFLKTEYDIVIETVFWACSKTKLQEGVGNCQVDFPTKKRLTGVTTTKNLFLWKILRPIASCVRVQLVASFFIRQQKIKVRGTEHGLYIFINFFPRRTLCIRYESSSTLNDQNKIQCKNGTKFDTF